MTTQANVTRIDRIKVELVETNFLTRRPCHCCGGETEKWNVVAEVASGEFKGFRVCEQCLKSGDIAERMEQTARQHEAQAATLREMATRVEVPTYAEFLAAQERIDEAYCREVYGMSKGEREKLEAEQSAKHPTDPFGLPF